MGTAATPAFVRGRRSRGMARPFRFHSNPFWSAALAGVAAASLLLPPSAWAQVPGEELEQIFVTGSRIARPDFESASPIVSITADAFARTSSTSVDTVVSQLPQFSPDFTSTSNNPSNGGQGNVQLRGLGSTSTLVLLDGRRIVPANGNGVVDVNVIPASLVESVEVVSGGASAVYGSDAIAGVVNFKLRDKFNGVQFDGGWGQTDHGDGSEYSAGVTAGLSFAEGRGEAYGYIGYSEREAVSQSERRFSAVTLGYFGPGAGGAGPEGAFLPRGSGIIAEGRNWFEPVQSPSQAAIDALFESYGFAPGTVPRLGNAYSVNADGSVFSLGNGRPGSVVNYRGEQDPLLFNDRNYTYNFGPWNYLQLPLERVSAFARASLEVGSAAEIYGQALYADYTADTALAPTPAVWVYVPVTNPYLPADLRLLFESRPDPAADVEVAKRLVELGPRVASNEHDVFQGTIGLRGQVFGDWSYDAYVQAGSYDSTESQSGNALRSRIHELTYAADGGLSACGGLRLFGPDSVSRECADYIAFGGTNRAGFDQTIAEVSFSGTAASLPAGDLMMALGVMYKRDEYFYRADPIGSVVLDDGIADVVGFSASDDIKGSDHNTDLYVEAAIPVMRETTGVERLEVLLGYRHSEYDSAGGVAAYKVELLYDPVQALTLRSSYQHAVRAPSVFELYHPHLATFYDALPPFGVLDPCTAGSDARSGTNSALVEALCIAQGLPAALLPDYETSVGFHSGVYGGNPDLDPETADTLTVGLVLRPWSERPLWSSMRLSIDWYRIEVEEAIVQASAENYIPLCFDARVNPGFSADNEMCRLFSRDPASGDIVDLRDIYQNIVGFEVSGIDLQFDWSFAAGPGDVGINWLASWMDYFESIEARGLPPVDEVGRLGNFISGTLPEWKWNLNLSYTWSALSLGGRWRYIDGMRDREFEDFTVPSFDYFDLFASYVIDEGVLSGLTLRAGIENLTDEDPPLVANPIGANTDPSQYDVLGRRYYVNLTYRF
jgi:outer membrane receptor protein involved in Fe transport